MEASVGSPVTEAALSVRTRSAAAALALGALPVAWACGPEPSPVPAAPPGEPAATVAWEPNDLLEAPGEFSPEPGKGTSILSGVVVDEEGRPVPEATVEVRASSRGFAPTAPLLHASTRAGADGTFRVEHGPTQWRTDGLLMAFAPGYAHSILRSRFQARPGEACADPGEDVKVVLRKGIPVRGRVRARDGGGPDGPVDVRVSNPRNFFEMAKTDPTGGFSFLAPPGPIDLMRAAASP